MKRLSSAARRDASASDADQGTDSHSTATSSANTTATVNSRTLQQQQQQQTGDDFLHGHSAVSDLDAEIEETAESVNPLSPPLKRRRVGTNGEENDDDMGTNAAMSLAVQVLGDAPVVSLRFAGQTVTISDADELKRWWPNILGALTNPSVSMSEQQLMQQQRLRSEAAVTGIPHLPPDVFLHVAKFCDAPTLCSLRATGREMRSLLNSDAADVVWERALIAWEKDLDLQLERCRHLVPKVRSRLMDTHRVITPGGLLRDLRHLKQQISQQRAGRTANSEETDETAETLRRAFQKIRWFVRLTLSRMQHLLSKQRDADTEEVLVLAAEGAEAAFRFLLRTEPSRRRDARRFVSRICSSLLFDIVLHPRLQASASLRCELAERVSESYQPFMGEGDTPLTVGGGGNPGIGAVAAAVAAGAFGAMVAAGGAQQGGGQGAAPPGGPPVIPMPGLPLAGAPPPPPVVRRTATATAHNSAQLRSAVDDGRAVALAILSGWIPLQKLLKVNGWQEPLCWRLPDGSVAWRLPTLMEGAVTEYVEDDDLAFGACELFSMPDEEFELNPEALRTAVSVLDAEPSLVKRARMHVLRQMCNAPSASEALVRLVDRKIAEPSSLDRDELQYRRYVEVFGRGQDELAARVCFAEHSKLSSAECFTLVLHEAAKLFKQQTARLARGPFSSSRPLSDEAGSILPNSPSRRLASPRMLRRSLELDAAHTNTVFTAANAGIVADLMHDVAEVLSRTERSQSLDDARPVEKQDALARMLLLHTVLLTHAHLPELPASTSKNRTDGQDDSQPTNDDLAGSSMVDRVLDASLRGKFLVRYPTRSGIDAEFDITPHVVNSLFGVEPGWRVQSPLGDATVIGLRNEQLWFHVDSDAGASFWKNDVTSSDLERRGIQVIRTESGAPVAATYSKTSADSVHDLLPAYVSGLSLSLPPKREESMDSDPRVQLSATEDVHKKHSPALAAAAMAEMAGKLACNIDDCNFAHPLLGRLTGTIMRPGAPPLFDPTLFLSDSNERPMNAVEWFGAWSSLSASERRSTWFPAVLWIVARSAAASGHEHPSTLRTDASNPLPLFDDVRMTDIPPAAESKGDAKTSIPGILSLTQLSAAIARSNPPREVVLAFAHWAADVLKKPWETHKMQVTVDPSRLDLYGELTRRLSVSWLTYLTNSRAALVRLILSSGGISLEDLKDFFRRFSLSMFSRGQRDNVFEMFPDFDCLADFDWSTETPTLWPLVSRDEILYVSGVLAATTLHEFSRGSRNSVTSQSNLLLAAVFQRSLYDIVLALGNLPWCDDRYSNSFDVGVKSYVDPLWYVLEPVGPRNGSLVGNGTLAPLSSNPIEDRAHENYWRVSRSARAVRLCALIRVAFKAVIAIQMAYANGRWPLTYSDSQMADAEEVDAPVEQDANALPTQAVGAGRAIALVLESATEGLQASLHSYMINEIGSDDLPRSPESHALPELEDQKLVDSVNTNSSDRPRPKKAHPLFVADVLEMCHVALDEMNVALSLNGADIYGSTETAPAWHAFASYLATLLKVDLTDGDPESKSFITTELYAKALAQFGRNNGEQCFCTRTCCAIMRFLRSSKEEELVLPPHNQWAFHEHAASLCGHSLTVNARTKLTAGLALLIEDAPLLFQIRGSASAKQTVLKKVGNPLAGFVKRTQSAARDLYDLAGAPAVREHGQVE